MDRPPSRTRWLMGAAAGMLLALLIAPPTSWLVRRQIGVLVPRPGGIPVGASFGSTVAWNCQVLAQGAREYAAAHPSDYQVQLGTIMLSRQGSAERAAGIRDLESRFPDNPSPYANALRIASQSVGISRAEEDLLAPNPPDRTRTPLPPPPDPAQLAAFIHDAERGEAVDPDNAYFALMHATGLFAAGRDDEALAALHRAATKTTWREYYQDEVYGEWRVLDEGFGDRSALTQTSMAAAVLFPHLARMRATARVAVVKAMQAEVAGKPGEGIGIRHDLMRCGSLMRAYSPCAIGALVGQAITAVAMARPGGAPVPVARDKGVSDEVRRKAHVDTYCDYLDRTGHPEEVGWVRAEFQASETTRQAIRSNLAVSDPMRDVVRLSLLWAAGLVSLLTAVWVLAAGGTAALLSRSRWFRSARPLPRPIALGIWAAIATLGIAGACLLDPLSQVTLVFAVMAAPVAGLACLGAALRMPGVRRGLIAFLTTAGTLLALGFVLAAQIRTPIAMLSWMHALVDLGPESPVGVNSGVLLPAAIVAPLAVPFLAALSFAFVSLFCRVPIAVGIVRGFRGSAVAIACVIALAYGGLTLLTLRGERTLQKVNQAWVRGEMQQIAERTGKPWPGPAP